MSLVISRRARLMKPAIRGTAPPSKSIKGPSVSCPSRDTPGTGSHYHPLLSTSPPFLVRTARRVVAAIVDLRNLVVPSAKRAWAPPS
jgi:hypothetical protein